MLRELHIANLAVIEDAAIELREGLNCFTGQTGAGKSLVIGAFEALLGLRSATDMVRGGAAEARVSGVFELTDRSVIRRINEVADLDLDEKADSEQLLITRKVFSTGRTSLSINGRPATAAMVREIGQLLVDVHGQHDHQFLLRPSNQLLMLDRFAETESLREQFASLHHQIHKLRHRRSELENSANLRRQQLELYEFQAGEIDAAEPVDGEYDELAARQKLLSNLDKVRGETEAAHAALYEAEGSILERLQAVVGIVMQLSELDEELKPIAQSIKDAGAVLQDSAFDLSRYLNRVDLDPAELQEVTDRLNTLNRLIHKYGSSRPGTPGSFQQVIEARQHIERELTRLRGESEDLQAIDTQIAPLQSELEQAGTKLSDKRRAAAKKLRPLIESQLAELGMAGAKLDVEFTAVDPAAGESPGGFDSVEMLVQTNPGQPARPLRKIASGGELSRIMLAIKSIVADADRVSVLVFDEIDSNIGGRMGSVIGEKLRKLAAHHQVLCITHLPQIAAYADHHLRIAKHSTGGQTRTNVQALIDHTQRVDELAEMLTGKLATQTTRKQAAELLSQANYDATAGPKGKKAVEVSAAAGEKKPAGKKRGAVVSESG